MTPITLMSFALAGQRYALQASQVARLDEHPTLSRRQAASELLGTPAAPVMKRWLSLVDATGAWQLGVEGEVALEQWPLEALYPLPALLRARRRHPALCGVALDESHSPLWLLDAVKLSP